MIRGACLIATILLIVVSVYAGVTWRDFTERDKACFNLGAVYMLRAQEDPRYNDGTKWVDAANLAWVMYKEDTSRKSHP